MLTDLKDTDIATYEFKEGSMTNGNTDRDVLVRFMWADEQKNCGGSYWRSGTVQNNPPPKNTVALRSMCLCLESSNIQWEHRCSFGKYPSLRKVCASTLTLLEASSGSSSSLSKTCSATVRPSGLRRNSLYITGGMRLCLMSFGALVAEVHCQAWWRRRSNN